MILPKLDYIDEILQGFHTIDNLVRSCTKSVRLWNRVSRKLTFFVKKYISLVNGICIFECIIQ
jgi:hypothetical protein